MSNYNDSEQDGYTRDNRPADQGGYADGNSPKSGEVIEITGEEGANLEKEQAAPTGSINIRAGKQKTKKNTGWIIAFSIVCLLLVLNTAALGAVLLSGGSVGGLLDGADGDSGEVSDDPVDEAEANDDFDSPLVINGEPDVSPENIVKTGDEFELSTSAIASKILPSVVGVISESLTYYGGGGTGSGIILDGDGHVITNHHVIEGGDRFTVVLNDGTQYTATLVGSDDKTDIAVLKFVPDKEITPAEFGDSDKLRVGDKAVAIGNPYGLELQSTVTQGIISAINRDITIDDTIMTLIQTDAAINNGNSGGPLVNKYGQVVGINNIKITDGTSEGLGFAIPINTAKPVVDELLKNGKVASGPALGISGTYIDATMAAANRVPEGLYVSKVSSQGAVDNNPLQAGDIVTKINGTEFTSLAEFNREKEKFKIGDIITLTVYRDISFYDREEGEYLEVKARLLSEEEIESALQQEIRP